MAAEMGLVRASRAGVAGLEFALLSPTLLVLFLGTIDLSGALL
jgi:Flp pilus assembly protein TadG